MGDDFQLGDAVDRLWKRFERDIAKKLGGTRVSRGSNFSERKGDIDHPYFNIECKTRKNLPKIYIRYLFYVKPKNKHLVIFHNKRVAFKLNYLLEVLKGGARSFNYVPLFIPDCKKLNKFFEDSLKQAKGYDENKLSFVVLREVHSYCGDIVYIDEEGYKELLFNSDKYRRNNGAG